MPTNNYDVILTDNAKKELEKIYEYISKNLVSKISADNLMAKIEEKILRLEQFPFSCPEVRIKPLNQLYRKLIVDNYVALYKIDEIQRQVNIIHILYSGQDYINCL